MNGKAIALLALLGCAFAHAESGRRLLDDDKDDESKDVVKLVGYKQCGGLNGCDDDEGKPCLDVHWDGYECEEGFKCERQNQWYWQCAITTEKMDEITRGPDSESYNEPEPGKTKRYTQCGGSTGNCEKWGCMSCMWGDAECESGFECNKLSDAYWQCDPKDKVNSEPKKCKKAPNKIMDFGDGEDYELEDAIEASELFDEEQAEAPGPAQDLESELVVVEEEEEEEDDMPSFSTTDEVDNILGEPDVLRVCGVAVEDNEVDGVFMNSMMLDADTPDSYAACCNACNADAGCAAFQVNNFNVSMTCDMFSSVNDVVPASGVTAGVIMVGEEISVAGK